jgi:hypothetical protein
MRPGNNLVFYDIIYSLVFAEGSVYCLEKTLTRQTEMESKRNELQKAQDQLLELQQQVCALSNQYKELSQVRVSHNLFHRNDS